MRALVAAIAGSLLLAACGQVSDALAGDDLPLCSSYEKPADAVVAACDRLLAAAAGKPEEVARAHYYRGIAHSRQGKPKEALVDLDASLRLAPKNAEALSMRGMLHTQSGDFVSALRDLNSAVASDPASLDAVGNRAVLHQQAGRIDEAIVDFTRTIELAPTDFRGWNGRCWARAMDNRELEQALADCNKAIELQPTDWNSHNSRGFVLYRLGRHGEAIAAYDTAISGDPSVASSWLVRGLAKLALGEAGAETDIAKSRSIDPKVAARFGGYGIEID